MAFAIRGSSTELQICSYDGSDLVTVATGTPLTQGSLVSVSIQIINYGDSTSINVWLDGQQVISASDLALNLNGTTTLDTIELLTTSNAWYSFWSEIIVATEDTRNLSVATLVPNSQGAHSEWTGDYTSIDEISESVADTISSATSNQLQTFGLSDLLETSDVVKAVIVSAKALVGETGPQNIQLMLRTNDTDYVSETKSLGGSYTTVQNIWTTNPSGGSWSKEDVNSLEAGIKSIT